VPPLHAGVGGTGFEINAAAIANAALVPPGVRGMSRAPDPVVAAADCFSCEEVK
jgi:hypothetical protein